METMKNGRAKLLDTPESLQRELGYYHTLREIWQQPATWVATAQNALSHLDALRASVEGSQAIVLTGSGSSLYAGECLAPALQAELRVPVEAIAGGTLLTRGRRAVPPRTPCLLVSLARSGDSPESTGVVDAFLNCGGEYRHVIVTCNEAGRLAVAYRFDSRVLPVLLDDRTCDRSLVMTSSFTNLLLAARLLGMLDRAAAYQTLVGDLSRVAREVLEARTGPLAEAGHQDFQFAVFLGSGCRFGAAREAALKMLEMTAGRVRTMAETYLGLRHGPMAAIHADTVIVCFLSSNPKVRAYEEDLIEELNRKRLGARKIVVGDQIPARLLAAGDLAIECPGLAAVGDDNSPVIDVLVAQLLAFHRCLALGLRPDAPSEGDVIHRVVENFRIHAPAAELTR